MNEELLFELPLPDRRARLIGGVANLVAKQGFETFVCAPILRADETCFPDPFSLSRQGIRRLIRRLMAYAGMGHLSVSLELDDSLHVDELGNAVSAAEELPPAWFLGIEAEVCRFGLDVRMAGDPELLVGMMCHEVAHAFRELHGLRTSSRDIEEALTDLTTVYLGFGLLTTNMTWRYRTRGEMRAGYTITHRSLSRAGCLDPGEMSFLIALQSVARSDDAAQVRSLRSELGATQAELFDEAREWLLGEGSDAIQELKLPPRSEWPSPVSIRSACVTLQDEELAEPDEPLQPEPKPAALPNESRKVYRIVQRRTVMGTFTGLAICVLLWVFPVEDGPKYLLGALVMVVAPILGWMIRADECAGAGCDARLSPDATRCQSCGGTIAGSVRDRMERMAREEQDERGADAAPTREARLRSFRPHRGAPPAPRQDRSR